MGSGAPRVLVADDDAAVREVLQATLEIHGFEVVGLARDGEEAVRLFEALESPPDAVVLDERMPLLHGTDTAQRILAVAPNQVIVLFSAALTPDVIAGALNVGILQCVDKLEVRRLPRVLSVLLGL